MRILIIAVSLASVAAPASALSRYQSPRMTCAHIQERVQAEGAIILRYPSPSDPSQTRYDRYVRNSQFCGPDEELSSTFIPASDTKSCKVQVCVPPRY